MEFYEFPSSQLTHIFQRGWTTNQILIWDDTESVELLKMLKFEKSLDLEWKSELKLTKIQSEFHIIQSLQGISHGLR